MLPITNFMLSNIVGYIESPYAIWLPVALLGTIAVIAVLGLIYALSNALGRTELKTWVRAKLYDVVLSIILIFVFLGVFTAFFAIPPVPYFQTLGIVPSHCVSVTDFYSLAACNMQQFMTYTLNLNTFIYQFMLVFSLVPVVNVNTGTLLVGSVTDSISLSPISTTFFAGDLLGLLYALFIINNIQLLLLAASLLIFSTFMALGLLARLFVVSRTFGGSMIAFAVGVGVLYPLLVSFSYGFLNAGIAVGAGPLLVVSEWATVSFSLVEFFIVAACGLGCSYIPGATSLLASTVQVFLGNLIVYIGTIAVGLTLIPLLNFLIVDTFVLDFSTAIGEKLDFMSLITVTSLI